MATPTAASVRTMPSRWKKPAPQDVYKRQAVDGVSGATITSTAIKEAAAAALTAAGLNPDDYKTAVENRSLIHI